MGETSEMIVKEAVDRLQHVPYYFAQTALGAEDGGFAAIYDSLAGGDYDGRFNNEIGGELMAYVLGRSGRQEFARNLTRLFDMDAMNAFEHRLPESPSEADLLSMAEKVADATVTHVLDVFPSVGAWGLENDRIRIRDFVFDYMKAEIQFAAVSNDAATSRCKP